MAANPLKVLVELQAKQGAIVSGSAGLSVEHDAAIADALSVGGASALTGNVGMGGTLNVAGASTFVGAAAAQGGLTVTGAALDASAVSASVHDLSVTADAYVGGKLTVQGNLEVLGQIDAISRSDLQVTDTLIIAAKGAANAAAADQGGFKLEGADAKLEYLALDNSWNMNKKLNLANDLAVAGSGSIAGDLSITGKISATGAASLSDTLGVVGKITGEDELQIDGAANFDGAVTATAGLSVSAAATIAGGLTLSDTGLTISGGGAGITGSIAATSDISAGGNLEVTGYAEIGGTLEVTGVASFSADMTGSAGLALAGVAALGSTLDVVGAVGFDSTLDVAGVASFAANVEADALLKVAASGSLVVITAAESAGYYDVAKAIKLLDSNVGDNKTSVIAAYEDLRVQKTGAFTSGQAIVSLTAEGAAGMFDIGSIDHIALDIMVKDASGEWMNDLVAVHMFVDGAAVKVQIDALTEATHYRLLAVNEKTGKFTW